MRALDRVVIHDLNTYFVHRGGVTKRAAHDTVQAVDDKWPGFNVSKSARMRDNRRRDNSGSAATIMQCVDGESLQGHPKVR